MPLTDRGAWLREVHGSAAVSVVPGRCHIPMDVESASVSPRTSRS